MTMIYSLRFSSFDFFILNLTIFFYFAEILKIKISAFCGDDLIAWNFEVKGVFSVKSVYMLGL